MIQKTLKIATLTSLCLLSSAVQSSELDDLIATSGAIVSQIDRGILITGAAMGYAHTGTGLSSGQLSGTAYISEEQVTAYGNALNGMVAYLPYGSAQDYLDEQAQDQLADMEAAIDDFTEVVVDMLSVVEVNEMAEAADNPDDQAAVQEYVAANDMSISQEDADAYNQSLDAIETAANSAAAYIAVSSNPDAVAYLDQAAQDNNTRIEQNTLSYSASNQAVSITWASGSAASSIYLNGTGDFGIDIYMSDAVILEAGAQSELYLTGPTYLSYVCFTTGLECEETSGESRYIPDIMPLEERTVADKQELLGEIQLIKQALEDNNVSQLQGKLAALGVNLETIIAQQQTLLLLSEEVNDLEKEIETMKATVTTAQIVTEKVVGFDGKVTAMNREINDLWSAMDFLSENPLK